jgi:pimeloyl-ACP methyl ester carboxylesterase
MAVLDEVSHLEAGGHSIAYRRAGDGSPVLFLHGFLCDSRCWRTQLEGLSDRFAVIAWDAPGAGFSSDPPETFTLTDWANCLAAFMDALGVAAATIVGLSWGGILAQELYRLFPSRVRALIFVDTYAGWTGSFSVSIARQRLERCIRESSLSPDEFVSVWVPREFFTDRANPDLASEMASVVKDFHPRGFRLMARTLADTDSRELLTMIRVPALLLWGDSDVRSPADVVGEQFRAAIPGAELEILAGAGHVSNMEQPARFNAAVRAFCERVLNSRQ